MLILTPVGPLEVTPATGAYGTLEVVAYRMSDLQAIFPGTRPAIAQRHGRTAFTLQVPRRDLGRILGAEVAGTSLPLVEAIAPDDSTYRDLAEMICQGLAEAPWDGLFRVEPPVPFDSTPDIAPDPASFTAARLTHDPYDSLMPDRPTACEEAAAAGAPCPIATYD
jgi:hypothetical protein